MGHWMQSKRFTNGGSVLYLGDTAKKDLYVDEKKLMELGIPVNQHSKLPDVIIFDQSKNWLFLIEAVTSHGPVSPKKYYLGCFLNLRVFLSSDDVTINKFL